MKRNPLLASASGGLFGDTVTFVGVRLAQESPRFLSVGTLLFSLLIASADDAAPTALAHLGFESRLLA